MAANRGPPEPGSSSTFSLSVPRIQIRRSSSDTQLDKVQIQSASVYNIHGLSGSQHSLSVPPIHKDVVGYRGSNEFILTDDKQSTMDQIKSIGPWMRRKCKNVCRRKILYKRVPILNWLPKYTTDDAVGDLVAGITVGLTVIPQALAYSNIAGLPAAYGLYGSFVGCFVYILLGSCKDVPMGPTAIASLLTFQACDGVWQRAVLLCFLSGLIELLMGLFGLGFLIDFVSGPVSSGFTSAVSLIILSSQVKDLLGIVAKGNTFIEQWSSIIDDIHNTQLGDAVMGFTCIIVLLLMRLLPRIKFGPPEACDQSVMQRIINKSLWLIGTARNAIIVIVCGGIGAAFYENGKEPFRMIGDVPSGLPSVQAPPFSVPEVVNATGAVVQEYESFGDMLQNLGSMLIVIPLIALLENIAICKAFADGKPVDATQELIAIGVSNIANSFVQGYPGTGALSRGAVNNASGVRTPFGGLYTGLLVIFALLFFTPYFFYIPRAALAAIIIAAVIFMIEVRVVKPMWRSKKTDLIPGLATFVACLALPLEYGILVGIGLNILFILYHAARPKIHMDQAVTPCGVKYLMLTPDRCLIFPSVDYVRNLINKHGLKSQIPVVIDCTHIYGADFTAAQVIDTLIKDFKSRNQLLLFLNLKPSVGNVFEGADLEYRVFYDFEQLDKAIRECRRKSIGA
ncbi:sodium-independent sulfate anion transporter-like [Anopheles ziemanni]|uniref:sodium-independent sulfate anion transporter-like n=1 Tax=Anopheles coustani TaxID=139045 RepID=UPI00265A7092|nr:sodium-independent sulfate anion transporter-like [Anopheles coustani]XP_058173990.1 sodium-independent sulfate anion transporter-like [Anopheles ziemanni]